MLERIERLKKLHQENRLFQYKPYGWQNKFHAAGKDYPERMLCAANRVGKTYSAAHEASFHATGLYPDDWDGRRFTKSVLMWAGGVTNESLRDIIQKELLGGMGDQLGLGAIPKRLIGTVTKRQCGIGDVVDTVRVKHVSGDWSTIAFKSYEQGWKKWQGTAPDYIWLDEEPEYKIYTECQTRILTSKGSLVVTFTPLSGLTAMVEHFNQGKPGTFVLNVTWDDVDHISEEDKKRLWDSLPEHEREARAKGIPMRGQGRCFPIDEKEIICKRFQVPDYWAQMIGIDFGWDHPAATAKLVWDRDNDIYYLVESHKKAKMLEPVHAETIKGMGGRLGGIPVSWPHDGHKTTGRDGKETRKRYKDLGVNMLSRSARFDIDVGGGQPKERSVQDFLTRMETGKFKVFEGQTDFLEEFRNFHRKDGKIVDTKDDILSALFYAAMMIRRFGRTTQSRAPKKAVHRPMLSSRA